MDLEIGHFSALSCDLITFACKCPWSKGSTVRFVCQTSPVRRVQRSINFFQMSLLFFALMVSLIPGTIKVMMKNDTANESLHQYEWFKVFVNVLL